MKALLVMTLSSLCATAALADEAPTELAGRNAPIVEDYSYSTHLDVAKVVHMSNVPEVCRVVPVQMEYDDSQGQRHILNYHVMGGGCSNG
ncbi:DUF2790 domain-containing protein [Pseudomonas poae]|uniref:DUF2790 domain-containing protein n=1 Tax=Pseudomonas poae TaxID=200451 RepID=A0AAP2S3Q7_9PSED|nr:DUF2790 domain-containing protein [Pseudomonas poae]ELQ17599.1 hypothetical protein A986_09335 [Pseudomonas fluorescens BRIP34879]KTC37163.1 hypothetical protein AO260_06780 [Pseudomonas sp. ABAC21]KRP47783.1 hypothetical protein TU75_18350 [Pseudomonas poae]MBC3199710.1 DUF2790 domain-containing protein [Pseudomonas poae]MCF5656999.1 DUF2790 domain-containing protein [Pseudomonas poae]